jgi:diguanylate cyclase (GGDEF)-like protein
MLGTRAIGAYSDNFAYEPTTTHERTAASAVAISLSLALALLATVAHVMGPALLGFVPVIEAVIVTCALFTAWMLFSQYRIRQYAPLAILACAYALFGLLHAGYLLTYPGVFVASGAFGTGVQTAPWIFEAARIGFAGTVLAFVYVERSRRRRPRWHAGIVARTAAATLGYLCAAIILVTAGHPWLPALMLPDGTLAPFFGDVVAPATAALLLGSAGAVVLSCGLERRVHLWLAVVLLAMALEVLAGVIFGGKRFSIGWYAGHVDAALSATLFFLAMQAQLSSILRRAARDGERALALHHIVSLGNESSPDRNAAMLEVAALDLEFDWACIARLERGWITLETSVGDSPYPSDFRVPVDTAWQRAASKRRDLTIHEDGDMPWVDRSSTAFGEGSTFVAVPVFVDDELYGLAGFANGSRRSAPINEPDRAFLRLLGSLAGVAVERLRQRRQLNALAYHDALTGLPNRASLFERLQQEVALSQRYDRQFAVHFLDLDGFKAVNDSFGHAVGDDVLREVARRLSDAVRESDTVARLGGDEFVVLQPEVEDPKAPERLAARLRDALKTPFPHGGEMFSIGTSIGTSRFPSDGSEIHALIDRADEALYRQKARRRKKSAGRPLAIAKRPPN